MKDYYNNKVVVVTGAARGIGKSIAMRFADAGAIVVIADINKDAACLTAQQIVESGGHAEAMCVDLSDPKQAELMIHSTYTTYESLDILVNNAKGPRPERNKLQLETYESFEKAFTISLRASFIACQTFASLVPKMSHNRAILNISSVAAAFISHEPASYHIVKAGIESLTRYFAVFGGNKGIRVNAIRPGFIVQDEHLERYAREDNSAYRKMAESCHPLHCVGSSNDIAEACLFLCSDRAKFITGQVLTVDGGLTLQEPASLFMKLTKQFYAV